MTAPESISRIARGVLKVKINSRGDTLFLLDEGLCFYSTALGYAFLFPFTIKEDQLIPTVAFILWKPKVN
jgi:hypothetical protein